MEKKPLFELERVHTAKVEDWEVTGSLPNMGGHHVATKWHWKGDFLSSQSLFPDIAILIPTHIFPKTIDLWSWEMFDQIWIPTLKKIKKGLKITTSLANITTYLSDKQT